MLKMHCVLMLLLLVGCDLIAPKDGVREVLGLKFGVPLDLKIKDGPRGPPIFAAHLKEFYEVEFLNMEFEFVGVAITKNSDATRKEGIVFERERLIWGAFFSNKKPCEEKDYFRTKAYLEKNWKISVIQESRNKPEESFHLTGTFLSPNAAWEISCYNGLGHTLTVADYSVLRAAADAYTKVKIDQIVTELNAVTKRKM